MKAHIKFEYADLRFAIKKEMEIIPPVGGWFGIPADWMQECIENLKEIPTDSPLHNSQFKHMAISVGASFTVEQIYYYPHYVEIWLCGHIKHYISFPIIPNIPTHQFEITPVFSKLLYTNIIIDYVFVECLANDCDKKDFNSYIKKYIDYNLKINSTSIDLEGEGYKFVFNVSTNDLKI